MAQLATLFDLEFDRRLSMAREHIVTHHGYVSERIKDADKKHSGYITIAVKKTDVEIGRDGGSSRWIQHHYRYEHLLRELPGLLARYSERDIYFTANTTWNKRRVTEAIRQYRCVWADIDCAKVGLTPNQALTKLEREVFGKTLPAPNRIIFSGTGLWAYWDIEPVPYLAEARWRAVQRQFNYHLRQYGADPQAIDAVRVCRLAGTYNSKNGMLAECMIYDDETRYDLAELAAQYLPVFDVSETLKVTEKATKKRQATIHSIRTDANYFYSLREDLLKLCELRGYNMTGSTGKVGREFTLFLVRHFGEMIHGDREVALQEALELNARFTEPLSATEIPDTKSRKGVVYRYRRATLIEKYDITEEEQRHMRLLVGDVACRERRQEGWRHAQARRRKEAGVVPRDVKRDQDIERLVKALRSEPEASLRRLEELTGFSKNKCSRLKKDAVERLSQKPHPIIVKLPHVFFDAEVFSEVAVSFEVSSESFITSSEQAKLLWASCLMFLEERLSRLGRIASFAAWLVHTVALDLDGGVLFVSVPNDFARIWIQQKLAKDIALALEACCSMEQLRIECVLDGELFLNQKRF